MHRLIQLQALPQQQAALQDWCLNDWGLRLAQRPELHKVIVNLAVPDMEMQPYSQAESLLGNALKLAMTLPILSQTAQPICLPKNIF